MEPLEVKYVVDREGNRLQVILDYKAFLELVEELEMADDIRAYDQAVAENAGEPPVPFEQVIEKLDRSRRNSA